MAGLIVWSVLVTLTGVICIVVVCALRKPMDELLKANSYVFLAKNSPDRILFSRLVLPGGIYLIYKT